MTTMLKSRLFLTEISNTTERIIKVLDFSSEENRFTRIYDVLYGLYSRAQDESYRQGFADGQLSVKRMVEEDFDIDVTLPG